MIEEHLSAGQLYEGVRNANHLEGCEACRRKLAWIEFMRESAPAEDANEPPEEILMRTLQLGGSGQTGRLLRWVRATLVFDTVTLSPDSGVRHTDAEMRQMVYRTDDLEFTVSLQRTLGRGYIIVGQAQPASREPVGVLDVCLQTHERLYTTLTDHWGEFHFSSLPASEYRITAMLADGPVMLPPFAALSA